MESRFQVCNFIFCFEKIHFFPLKFDGQWSSQVKDVLDNDKGDDELEGKCIQQGLCGFFAGLVPVWASLFSSPVQRNVFQGWCDRHQQLNNPVQSINTGNPSCSADFNENTMVVMGQQLLNFLDEVVLALWWIAKKTQRVFWQCPSCSSQLARNKCQPHRGWGGGSRSARRWLSHVGLWWVLQLH